MSFPDVILAESLQPGAALILGAEEINILEVPSNGGIPIHLLTSRARVGDSAEADQKHRSQRLARKSPLCVALIGSSCLELATEKASGAHRICGEVCHSGQVPSAVDVEGQWQNVG